MISTKELFLWIQTINKNNERDLDALYIFLDLMGGISKKELTLLKLKQTESTYLQKDLKTLKKKNGQIILNILSPYNTFVKVHIGEILNQN